MFGRDSTMKTIVCDSSSLISLAESCSLGALGFLKHKFDVDFVIPPSVENEIVERPSKYGRFSFSAARLKHLLNEKVLRVASTKTLFPDSQKILSKANSLFRSSKPLSLLQSGEAECLALVKPLQAQALLIDEKTTRLLLEDPKKLYYVMQAEHKQVVGDEKALAEFKKSYAVTAIRSTELLAFAAQNGFFSGYGRDANEVFHAAIYALRYAGCSISQNEIDDYQKIDVEA